MDPMAPGLPVWQKLTTDKNGDGNARSLWVPKQRTLLVRLPESHSGAHQRQARQIATFEGVSPDGLKFVGYFDSDPNPLKRISSTRTSFRNTRCVPPNRRPTRLLTGFSAMACLQDLILGTLKDQFPDFKIGAMEPPYWVDADVPNRQLALWHLGRRPRTLTKRWRSSSSPPAMQAHGSSGKYKNQLPRTSSFFGELPGLSNVSTRA